MGASFDTVGLICRRGKPEIADSVAAVYDCLQRHRRTVLVETYTARHLPETPAQVVERQHLGERCDLIVVVGGDGSLLGVGRDLARFGVPVVGVNRGGLGFLADIAPEQIDDRLQASATAPVRIDVDDPGVLRDVDRPEDLDAPA
jgi:NAD+ kinase